MGGLRPLVRASAFPHTLGMATSGKRVKQRPGDVLKIDLGDGSYSYAQVGPEPVIIFFDGTYRTEQPPEEAVRDPVAFRICVMNYAVTTGLWPVVGRAELTTENAAEPFFYKQDSISGRLYLYHSSFAATNFERPASLLECEALECAAVWEPEHVIERLRDHFAGRENRWLASMRIDSSRVPTA